LAEDRLKIWEPLFEKTLQVIDSADAAVFRPESWSFGGGTVLMRRYRHRVSKDIDIFVPDPQYLGYVNPRLNDAVDELTSKYLEGAAFLKLYFDMGEVDFVVSPPLTKNPTVVETLFGRRVRVETSAEILAKKIKYRGPEFKARDIFDFALVVEKEPTALAKVRPLIREKRDAILARIASNDKILRKSFAELEVLDYRRTYDECVSIVAKVLEK
jgi:predicted nucleotidyltransferase component of viral defense system